MEILPSLLSANWYDLKASLKKMKDAKIKILHFDIMDGHYVDNISFGPMLLKDLILNTNFKIDAHLMIEKPLDYIDELMRYKVSSIIIHLEILNPNEVNNLVSKLHERGIKFGLSLKPNQHIELMQQYWELIDILQIMTVEPGRGGQMFLDSAIPVIEQAVSIRQQKKLSNLIIQVDGGINDISMEQLKDFNIDNFVVGSYLFNTNNIKKAVQILKHIKNE